MVDSEKQDRFEEAFKRGQEGEVSSFDAWLQDQDFKPERVDIDRLSEYYKKHPDDVPNHQDELEDIAEYIGFFSRRKGTYHVPVTGTHGIGKTQLLHTVAHMLNRVAEEIPQRFYTAGKFDDEGEELDQYFDEVVDDLRQLDQAVILVDDCSEYNRIKHALSRINKLVEDSFILTAWTPERWGIIQDQINESLSLTQEIRLTPFDERNTIQALETATDVMSGGEQSLPESIFKRIHEKSYGIPRLFNTILIKTLRETFHKELQLGDVEAVDIAVEKLNLRDAKERIYDISEKKLTILKHILLAYDPRGRRPTELVELLDRDKSTISYHLQELRSDKIVESEKSGRQVFYRVHDCLKPLLQIRISQEGKFHA